MSPSCACAISDSSARTAKARSMRDRGHALYEASRYVTFSQSETGSREGGKFLGLFPDPLPRASCSCSCFGNSAPHRQGARGLSNQKNFPSSWSSCDPQIFEGVAGEGCADVLRTPAEHSFGFSKFGVLRRPWRPLAIHSHGLQLRELCQQDVTNRQTCTRTSTTTAVASRVYLHPRPRFPARRPCPRSS